MSIKKCHIRPRTRERAESRIFDSLLLSDSIYDILKYHYIYHVQPGKGEGINMRITTIGEILIDMTQTGTDANGNKIFAAIPAMPTEDELTEE